VTALAFVLTIGDVARFAGSKQLTNYLGLVSHRTQLGHQAPPGSHYQAGQLLSTQAAGGSGAEDVWHFAAHLLVSFLLISIARDGRVHF
jgi:Transposase IS116/IS110/IS902 family